MRIQVLESDPPILVREVKEIESRGKPCWLIIGEPVRVPLHGGGCVEMVSYVVPMDYDGLRRVA
jgi:hypothetical protein